MNDRLPHLAQRILNRPVMLHPDKAEVIIAALADRLGVSRLFGAHGLRPAAEVIAIHADNGLGLTEQGANPRAGYILVDGVAVIEVEGTLVQKTGCLTPYSGMTGYDGIRANLIMAMNNPSVRAVALDLDSPGGEVAGCFDLADLIRQCAQEKPIWAILDEMACSAAYAIASACTRVTIPRTGIAGSIGVIAMHADFSRALDKDGITVTLITHGAHKADGNPYQPLEGEALRGLQADIDAIGGLFAETVARNRRTTAAQVQALEAATFMGADAIAAGLADAIMPPDQALRDLIASL